MSRGLGSYDHLNEDTPVRLKAPGLEVSIMGMETLVRAVRSSNYGVHRFLSELVRQDKNGRIEGWDSRLIDTIERLLEEGHY